MVSRNIKVFATPDNHPARRPNTERYINSHFLRESIEYNLNAHI